MVSRPFGATPCSKKKKEWRGCGALNQENWYGARTTTEVIDSIIQKTGNGQERKAIKLLLILITWEIWQERNSCRFRHKIASAAEVIAKIRNNMELWNLAGAKCFEYPFGVDDARN